MSVVDHQRVHTIRLEATALERRIEAMPVPDSADAAVVAVLLLVSKRLELLETALLERTS